ncbi:MAG TPA: transketolase [Candidatus Gallacutalibacter pullicola]|uniref:Transketolase n=1 Tax=Candidatus Gallacutalibacter pullicola TaxID=2840830 RepID=A0A9D1DRI0_9FIRM|nr:transketolase [Candidatus Gallacutalibacter pullicola]
MNLKAKSFALRKDILDMVYLAKTGHIGGDFSVCDILNVLYNRQMNLTPENFSSKGRDHFILSKGHSVEALYAVLADKGFFPKELLKTYSQFGSDFIGHPNNKIPGIEMNSGSLGHGLSVGVGMAIAEKRDGSPARVYVVMGDGELAEGSVWEAAMAASHYGLDNLTAIVDRNGLQISGSTEQVMAQESQRERWSAFGWHVLEAKGNDVAEISAKLEEAAGFRGKPCVIIAHTVKGYGVSFMENRAEWHHKVPDREQYETAMAELDRKLKEAMENE